MALHLVSRSPGESPALAQCLARVGAGDAVVLLEGGVYAALQGHALAFELREALLSSVAVYALSADLAARGIAADELLAGILVVDYAAWVELSLRHTPALSWR